MIDWVALAWLASSIVLTVFSSMGFMDAARDVRAWSGGIHHDGAWALAWDALRIQAVFLFAGICWTYLGATRAVDGEITTLSEGIAILITVNVAMAVVSAWSVFTRRADMRQREVAERLGRALNRRSDD